MTQAKANHIGIDKKESEQVVEKLNRLLATYSVFYMNVRGYHWNVKGALFFALHAKFEEMYDDLATKIDEIAERVLTLGCRPDHAYSVYLKNSSIKEDVNADDGKTCAKAVLDGLKTLVKEEKELLAQAEKDGDEGTAAMMSDYIASQEKTIWMYSAFLAE